MLRYFSRTAAAPAASTSQPSTAPPAVNDLATDDATPPAEAPSTSRLAEGSSTAQHPHDGDGSHQPANVAHTSIAASSAKGKEEPSKTNPTAATDSTASNHPSQAFYTCVDFVKVEGAHSVQRSDEDGDSSNLKLSSATNDDAALLIESELQRFKKEAVNDDEGRGGGEGRGEASSPKRGVPATDDADDLDFCLDVDDDIQTKRPPTTETEHTQNKKQQVSDLSQAPAGTSNPTHPSDDTKHSREDTMGDEWDNVTMSTFREKEATSTSQAAAFEGKAVNESITSPSGTAAPEQKDPPQTTATVAAVPETMLRARAKDQRAREDAEREALRLLARQMAERQSIEAAKRLVADEDAHLRRAREELAKEEAEQARQLAAQLDREEAEQIRRKLADAMESGRGVRQSASASPTGQTPQGSKSHSLPSHIPPHGSNTPVAASGAAVTPNGPRRQCDCLGASSGFHRQGCPLR